MGGNLDVETKDVSEQLDPGGTRYDSSRQPYGTGRSGGCEEAFDMKAMLERHALIYGS